jgi:hypothetical protein
MDIHVQSVERKLGEQQEKDSEVKVLQEKYEQDMKIMREDIKEEMKKQMSQLITRLKPDVISEGLS